MWNLFEVNNKERHQNDAIDANKNATDVVWMSYLLTFNRFHTLFWRFHYWLWTSKWRLGWLSSLEIQSALSHQKLCSVKMTMQQFVKSVRIRSFSGLQCSASPRIQSECGKIQQRRKKCGKKSKYRDFLRVQTVKNLIKVDSIVTTKWSTCRI